MSKKKESSYQKLKNENEILFEDVLCLIQRPDSMDAEIIRIKYRNWLQENEEFQWVKFGL